MSRVTVKIHRLVAPKLDRKAAAALLQQHVELMDVLRDVQARMKRLTPTLHPNTGYSASVFYGACEAWQTRTANIRTLYDEVEQLAVAINLQAL